MYEPSNILISITFILLHFFLFLFNFHVFGKKYFQPAVLFSLLWLVIVSIHFACSLTILDKLDPLSVSTYLLFFIGAVCFSLGSFLVHASWQKRNMAAIVPPPVAEYQISLLLRLTVLAIALLGLPFYIRATYQVFIASQIENFFEGVRTAITYYDEDVGPTKYLSSFSYLVFAIMLYAFLQKRNWTNRIMLILSLLASLTYAVLSTGRTFFLIILVLYVGVSYFFSNRFVIKKYIWLAAAFLAFFMLIGVFWGKGGDKESSAKDNLRASTEVTATYLVLSLNAMDYENTHFMKINYRGDNTLRFFIKTGKQLNLISEKKVARLVKEFLFLPYGTNVYTVYSDYIHDFGKLFAWCMIFLFGILHTWIHNQAARTKSFRYVLYFSFLLFPLLMSFFQDQYMSLFSTWLQIVFYVEVFLVVNKIFIDRKW